MNRRMNFQHLGGLFFTQDVLDYLQSGYSGALDALAKIVGDKVILSGVPDQGATSGEGWIAFNGEALPFVGGLKAPYIIVEEIVQDEQYDDNLQRPAYYTRRLKYGNLIPVEGGFPATDLTRLPFAASNIKDALFTMESTLKAILNVEPTVILSGCTVDNIAASTLRVAAGLINFSGKLVATPEYNGNFPAYISEAGAWSTAQPGVGLYVKFDPHTSQYYKDVLYRYNHRSGEIIMSTVLSDRFDANGVGKWEWLGFKLCSTLRGRVPVGYWFGGNDDPFAYDPAYTDPTQTGGAKNHTLSKSELPNVTVGINIYRNSQDYVDGNAATNNIGTNPSPSNPAGAVTEIHTDPLGDGLAFDIRQPYRVTVFIERI